MPRIAYVDAVAGVAGDMLLGALLDAGYPLAALQATVDALQLPPGEVTLSQEATTRRDFRATRALVEVHADDAPARHLADILAILTASTLPEQVKADAARVFTRLAEAEARVHGTTVEAVHFHEVGATDAIVDVVGTVSGLHHLGIDQLHVSPLPTGGGFINAAHGTIPIPGPAVLELLKGFPVYHNGIDKELVTPTGAALVTTLGRPSPGMPVMTVDAIGIGAGTRDLPTLPNVTRLVIGEMADALHADAVVVLEASIDDMNPQLFEPAMAALFAAGALDVYLTPILMKKGRPAQLMTVLAPPSLADTLCEVMLHETTTIGIRKLGPVPRYVAPREIIQLQTPHGPVPAKVARSPRTGEIVNVWPEHDAVVALARALAQPTKLIEQAAAAAAANWRQA